MSEFAMGTICTVNLFDQGTTELYSKVFVRLRELEDIFSVFSEDSDLYQVNQNAGLEPVKVRRELIEVLSIALKYAEKSGGAFDPTIGPLIRLWDIGDIGQRYSQHDSRRDGPRVPSEEAIRQALNLVNYRDVEINHTEQTVFLTRPGMALDLGAIAKGFAADEIVRLLEREGLKRAIIDLGGDIFAFGAREDGNNWRIGIQDPGNYRGDYFGILEVNNKSVVTSGVYERYFMEDDRLYHHILSIESGFPVDNGLLSVTVIAEKAIDADAISTTSFTLGWERGLELIAQIPGAAGIFLSDDLTLRLSEGLEEYFTITADEISLEQGIEE